MTARLCSNISYKINISNNLSRKILSGSSFALKFFIEL